MKNSQLLLVCFILLILFSSLLFPERVVISLPGDEVFRARTAEGPVEFHTSVTDPDINPVIIPLKRAGRLFLFDAVVDGVAGNFIFDTGSKEIVLNSTYFRNRVQTGKVNSSGITGELDQVGRITLGSLAFNGLEYKNLTVHLAGLGHIESQKGVKILGLAGFNLFKKYETVIDPLNSELQLFRIDRDGNRTDGAAPGFVPDVQQKISRSGNVLFLQGSIGNKLLNFCFDTAAETNVISSSSAKQVLSTLTITRRILLKGAGAVTSEVLFGKMNDFSISSHKISGMETIITNLQGLNDTYDTHIEGILGCSFLEHGTVCVNFTKSQIGICFYKNKQK